MTASLDTAGVLEILQTLPHRYPFLMIDRVVQMRADEFAVGIKNVTFNEPQFQGHFPGQPVFPGVLMVEGMAQTAGVLCVSSGVVGKPKAVYFLTIDNAKFRKPVVPGDQLKIHVKKIKMRGNLLKFACEAMVEGAKAAEAEISAMMVTG